MPHTSRALIWPGTRGPGTRGAHSCLPAPCEARHARELMQRPYMGGHSPRHTKSTPIFLVEGVASAWASARRIRESAIRARVPLQGPAFAQLPIAPAHRRCHGTARSLGRGPGALVRRAGQVTLGRHGNAQGCIAHGWVCTRRGRSAPTMELGSLGHLGRALEGLHHGPASRRGWNRSTS